VTPVASPDRFVVCGLGGLGQHCVEVLREFGVVVTAIDRVASGEDEVPEVRGMLEGIVVGDPRDLDVLRRAGAEQARGILLTTPDERVNVETAFAARRLNPGIRLVVRCARESLNGLLARQLGNFVAFEPTHLAAPAFALAATEDDVVGLFRLGGRVLRVVEGQVGEDDRGVVHRPASHLDTRSRRVVAHRRAVDLEESRDALREDPGIPFHRFDPEALVAPGDVITTVELADVGGGRLRGAEAPTTPRRGDGSPGDAGLPSRPGLEPPPGAGGSAGQGEVTRPGRGTTPAHEVTRHDPIRAPRRVVRRLETFAGALGKRLRRFFSPGFPQPIARVAILVGVAVLFLVTVGAVALAAAYPGVGLGDAFFAAVVLLLGGYGDRFDDFGPDPVPVPGWVRGYALAMTVAGTALVGVVYAMVTEKLLTMRLQFLARRPPVPREGHVVVVGLGRVGQRVAAILRELELPAVGVSASGVDPDVLPWLPVVTGRAAQKLDRVHLDRALGLVASTADDMDNLETALLAHRRAPDLRLVVRASDARFSRNVSSLLPYANVLSGTALSAEVFAAAAFGENVLSLFRLEGRTVMVTDYAIEEGDTLAWRLIGDVAEGYGLVPLLCEREAPRDEAPPDSLDEPLGPRRQLLPSGEIRLLPGDRLVVLATTASLQRVERGRALPRSHRIVVAGTLTPDAVLGGAAEISRRTGASMAESRAFMDAIPGTFPRPLYRRQAVDLVRSLKRHQVLARAVAVDIPASKHEIRNPDDAAVAPASPAEGSRLTPGSSSG